MLVTAAGRWEQRGPAAGFAAGYATAPSAKSERQHVERIQRKREVEQAVLNVRTLFAKGDYDAAIAAAEAGLQIDPEPEPELLPQVGQGQEVDGKLLPLRAPHPPPMLFRPAGLACLSAGRQPPLQPSGAGPGPVATTPGPPQATATPGSAGDAPPASAVAGDDGESPAPPARSGRGVCPGRRRVVWLLLPEAPQGCQAGRAEGEEEQQEFEPKGLAMPTLVARTPRRLCPRRCWPRTSPRASSRSSSPTTTAPPTFEMLSPSSGDEPGGMDNLPTGP